MEPNKEAIRKKMKRVFLYNFYFFNNACIVSPISAGDLDMLTPDFSNALILSIARPDP
jgi:hypothetical protein